MKINLTKPTVTVYLINHSQDTNGHDVDSVAAVIVGNDAQVQMLGYGRHDLLTLTPYVQIGYKLVELRGVDMRHNSLTGLINAASAALGDPA